MTAIHRSALVPYSAQEMFDLVADIPAYPRFLPWCGGARILSRENDAVIASIDIAYSGVHKTFTTRNLLQNGKMMEIRLLDGQFYLDRPLEHYAWLRRHAPVYWDEAGKVWGVALHEDIMAVSRSPDVFCSRLSSRPPGMSSGMPATPMCSSSTRWTTGGRSAPGGAGTWT